MKFSSTKIILTVAALLALALIVLNYFLFERVKSTNMRSSENARQISLYEKRKAELTPKNGIADINSLIDKIDSYFVGKDGAVGFIEIIENEAKAMGVTLLIRAVNTEKFDPALETEDPVKEILRLKLETKGTWQNTVRLISFIEHLPYKVTLAEVSLSKMSEGEIISGELLGPAPKKSVKAKVSAAPLWKARLELTVLKHK